MDFNIIFVYLVGFVIMYVYGKYIFYNKCILLWLFVVFYLFCRDKYVFVIMLFIVIRLIVYIYW